MWGLNRRKLLIIAASVCAGALMLDRMILPPLLNTWSTRAERIAELKAELDESDLLLDRETTIRDRWADMLDRALPSDHATAENLVLNAVDTWAEQSRLSISSLKPRWLRTEGAFSQLEVRATALGRPEAVYGFLFALEQDGLPLCVENVKLVPRDERGRALALDVTFTALTELDDSA